MCVCACVRTCGVCVHVCVYLPLSDQVRYFPDGSPIVSTYLYWIALLCKSSQFLWRLYFQDQHPYSPALWFPYSVRISLLTAVCTVCSLISRSFFNSYSTVLHFITVVVLLSVLPSIGNRYTQLRRFLNVIILRPLQYSYGSVF